MKIDLHFPMALKQKQAQCSILSLKQTNSTYQSFKNGLCLECSQTSGFIWYDLYFIYFISNLLYVYSQQCLQLGETKQMTEANNSIMSLVFGTSIGSPSGGSVSVKRKHFTSPLYCFIVAITQYTLKPFQCQVWPGAKLNKISHILFCTNVESKQHHLKTTGREVSFEWSHHRILSTDS